MTCKQILGIEINAETYEGLCQTIDEWIQNGDGLESCCYTNPHSLVMCQQNEEFRRATQASSLILADGVGVIVADRLTGSKLPGRVSGPESMLRVMDFGRSRGYRHFLYGSTPEVLEQLETRLMEKFPDLQICGKISPPFRELTYEEIEREIQEINAADPSIVWVGLGAPKQEVWINKRKPQLKAPVAMAVGAAFDYHAGNVSWAPKMVRSLGLEWAYRLFQQPKRLWRRNLNSLVFLHMVLTQRWFGRAS